jgi:hypothetical protein
MIADAIRFVLTHMPVILTLLALLCAMIIRRGPPPAERYLSWLLLLAVGAESVWGGAFHVFFPSTAASFIGWQTSPFQFEVGVADLAISIVAVVSFWRGLDFKAAVVGYIVLFYGGVAIGHVHQMLTAGNTSPGNFGALLVLTLIKLVVLPWLLHAARRQAAPATLSVRTPGRAR